MTLKQLQDITDYALEQAKNDCGILTSTTGQDYTPKEYADQQLKDLNAIKQELEAVRKLYDLMDESKTWHDEVYIITSSDLCDVLNIGLYDFYGECYRMNNNQALTSKEFISLFKDSTYCYSYTHFTDEMLDSGWQVIVDLYTDNEKEQANDLITGHFIQ